MKLSEADRILKAIATTRAERGVCTVDDVAAAIGLPHATAHRRLTALVETGKVEVLGRGGYRLAGERVT